MTEKHIPERTCVVCKSHKTKDHFIRVVKTKENRFFVDDTGKAEGRGVYVCKCEACIKKAVKSRVFSKIFRMDTPSELYEELKKSFEK